MKLLKAAGLVAHRLLDWKTVVNPITHKFYPELYSIKRLLPSFRKKSIQIYYTSPFPSLMIDRLMIDRFTPFNQFFTYDFPSLYPYNELKIIDNWIYQLKLMMNYFSGFGNPETADLELNKTAYQMREKIRKYRQKKFSGIDIKPDFNEAIIKSSLYCDTDSLILPNKKEVKLIEMIKSLKKRNIIVTGRKALGKSSIALKLAKSLNSDFDLEKNLTFHTDCDLFQVPSQNISIYVFPSKESIPNVLAKETGLLLEAQFVKRDLKLITTFGYYFNQEKDETTILDCFKIDIPFLDKEINEEFRKFKIKKIYGDIYNVPEKEN